MMKSERERESESERERAKRSNSYGERVSERKREN